MMKLFETIKDLLLAFSIAITLPTLVHWGVDLAFASEKQMTPMQATLLEQNDAQSPQSEEKKHEFQELTDKQMAAQQYKKEVEFWAALVIGILAIFIGSFFAVGSLSIGLIGGGTLNLFFALVSSPLRSPLANFSNILLLFMTLITIVITKKKSE